MTKKEETEIVTVYATYHTPIEMKVEIPKGGDAFDPEIWIEIIEEIPTDYYLSEVRRVEPC